MTSSIVGASAANLALVNQLPQAVAGGSQTAADGTTFKVRAEALVTALDSDGDGKVSKAETQTGFQKLSEDVKSVLLGQQDVAGADAVDETASSAADQHASSNAATNVSDLLESLTHTLRDNTASALFKSIDSNGDGSLSKAEFVRGLAGMGVTDTATTRGAVNAGSTGDTTGTTTEPTAADLYDQIDSNGDGNISRDEWQKVLQDLQSQDVGSLANQQGMQAQQHAATLNSSLINLLQSIESQSSTASATSMMA